MHENDIGLLYVLNIRICFAVQWSVTDIVHYYYCVVTLNFFFLVKCIYYMAVARVLQFLQTLIQSANFRNIFYEREEPCRCAGDEVFEDN